MADTISFARGAPSLDIVDQEGLKEAAQRAFTNDPGGTFAYGTSVGYGSGLTYGVGGYTPPTPASMITWGCGAGSC